MRKSCFIVGFALALIAAPHCLAQRQKRTLESFFPDRFGSWKATTSAFKELPPVEDFPLLEESGWKGSFGLPYSNGLQTVGVSLWEFRDPTGAYEAYTKRLTPEMHPSTVGELSAIDGKRLVMLIGNVLMEVNDPLVPSTKDLQELVKDVKRFTDTSPLPPIRSSRSRTPMSSPKGQ